MIAACTGLPTAMFFPEEGQTARPAKRVCDGCEVRQACLDLAMAADERHGVWGGLTVRERDALRHRTATPRAHGVWRVRVFDRASYMREWKRARREADAAARLAADLPATEYGRRLVLLLMEAGAA